MVVFVEEQAWYYAVGGRRYGPVKEGELQELARSGRIGGDAYVWKSGMANWTGISRAPAFQAFVSSEKIPRPDPPTQWGDAPSVAVSYAGFWKRFVANFIDSFVLVVLTLVVRIVLVFVFGEGQEALRSRTYEIVNLVGPVLGWLYYALMESSHLQGTLGTLAISIQVTDLQGRRLTFGRATARHFSKIVSVFTFWVGFLMAGFTERKQALHDLIASCLVINRR